MIRDESKLNFSKLWLNMFITDIKIIVLISSITSQIIFLKVLVIWENKLTHDKTFKVCIIPTKQTEKFKVCQLYIDVEIQVFWLINISNSICTLDPTVYSIHRIKEHFRLK